MKTKSITVGESFTTNTASLLINIFNNSPLLRAIGNIPLPSKTTKVPFTLIPEETDTEFVLGELAVTKAIKTTTALITDESIEDSTVDIDSTLMKSLVYLVNLDLEKTLVTKLKADVALTTHSETNSRDLILKLIKSYDSAVFSIGGPMIVAVSTGTHIDLILQENPVTEIPFIKLVASPALSDDDVVIIPTSGVAAGYSIQAIESERLASSGATKYHVQGTFGSTFTPVYVKRASL